MIESLELGRKEDGNRSIADKILKRLHELEKTVENNHGRWAWELLQNAKDSIADYNDKKVSIRIVLNTNELSFSHNGMYFSEQDVRGIINQISSKELQEYQQTNKTGRFGTGFLTTHLLSKEINISGVLNTQNNEFYKFNFLLDREGKTISELVPKIEKAWLDFHYSTTTQLTKYDEQAFNTVFSYPILSPEQVSISRTGLNELMNLMPFVLAFNPKIESVDIKDNTEDKHYLFKQSGIKNDDLITSIAVTENEIETEILILHSNGEKCSIATEVLEIDSNYFIKPIDNIPKLFCDFPLIGTENFHFPLVVNSFYFNPQTERDGVWLKDNLERTDKEVHENRDILKEATELFVELLAKLANGNYYNLYNISENRIPETSDKYFDEEWYKENIQSVIRKSILETPIVELEDIAEGKAPVKDLWFPLKSYSTKVSEGLWQFTYEHFPTVVCKKAHLSHWKSVYWDAWNKLTYAEIISDIEKTKNIKSLSVELGKSEQETGVWLNSLGCFILEDEANLALFEKSTITPNKYGVFCKRENLYIDYISDAELITVLKLLGVDWNNILLNNCVGFGKYLKKEKKDISSEITIRLKTLSKKDDRYIQAISILSEWFENNQILANDLFSELYHQRAELFLNTINDKESLYKLMRSKTALAQLSEVAEKIDANPALLVELERISGLSALLKEFNISGVAELKALLVSGQTSGTGNTKLDITQDIIIGLGVTSLQELQEALKDKNLAALFNHTSTHNVAMFIYAQGLISRAKNNIIEHLKKLPNYDCSEMEELAPTVIGGIKKHDLPIHIVIRPSDNNEVIIYYSSEKDTLDYTNAELWIDNGIALPKQLTLGEILKTTGIRKIPV